MISVDLLSPGRRAAVPQLGGFAGAKRESFLCNRAPFEVALGNLY